MLSGGVSGGDDSTSSWYRAPGNSGTEMEKSLNTKVHATFHDISHPCVLPVVGHGAVGEPVGQGRIGHSHALVAHKVSRLVHGLLERRRFQRTVVRGVIRRQQTFNGPARRELSPCLGGRVGRRVDLPRPGPQGQRAPLLGQLDRVRRPERIPDQGVELLGLENRTKLRKTAFFDIFWPLPAQGCQI